MPTRILLDHAAATPILPEAMAAMAEGMARWANPSSPHAEGRAARAALEAARAHIAAAFGWDRDIIFTSGASEALDIALNRQATARPVLASAVEHLALMRLRPDRQLIPVDADGLIDPAALVPMLQTNPGALVAVQMVNSETGIVQPIADLIGPIHAAGGVLLVDCSQAAGRQALPAADLIVISSHKIGGAPGAGALLVRDIGTLAPNGGQERGYRLGTENLPAILGFAAAAATLGPPQDPCRQRTDHARWRALLDEAVVAIGGELVGAGAPRLPHIGAYRLPGIAAATLLIRLDMAGFAISAGSACSSGSLHASHVLSAMGYTDAAAREVIRVSFGTTTTWDEIDAFMQRLTAIVADMAARR